MPMIRVRIKASRQVLDMVPNVARAMILGGTAEEVKSSSQPETMSVATTSERAVAPAQSPAKKSMVGKRRA
jgi:hypothetical protein